LSDDGALLKTSDGNKQNHWRRKPKCLSHHCGT